MKKNAWLLGFALFVAGALSGCGGSGSGIGVDTAPLDVDTPVSQVTPGSSTDLMRAVDAALARVAGTPMQAYLKREGMASQVWEVEILDANRKLWEVYINSTDFSVVKVEQKRPKDGVPTDITPTVTLDEAIAKALEAKPGTFVEAELEAKEGVVVWEVYVKADADSKLWKVHINATTGAVNKIKLDDDGDGKDDDSEGGGGGSDDDDGEDSNENSAGCGFD